MLTVKTVGLTSYDPKDSEKQRFVQYIEQKACVITEVKY